MPTVEFEDESGRVVASTQIPGEQQLLDVCDDLLAPVAFGCRAGRCGTCRVRVVAGSELLEEPGREECELLSYLALPRGYRLSCQVRLKRCEGTVRLTVGA